MIIEQKVEISFWENSTSKVNELVLLEDLILLFILTKYVYIQKK